MEDFAIRRDIVQEIAETGSFQVRGSGLIEASFDAETTTGPAGYAEFRQGDSKPIGLERANRMACAVLEMSEGRKVRDFELYVQISTLPASERLKLKSEDFHEDSELEDGMLTILTSIGDDVGSELITAGRGLNPDMNNLKRYLYSSGAIFIAGNGFGTAVLCKEFGGMPTQHIGIRKAPGKVLSLSYNPIFL